MISEQKPFISEQKRMISEQKHITSEQRHFIPEQKRIISEQTNIFSEQKHLISEPKRIISEQKHIISEQKHIISEQKHLISEQKQNIYIHFTKNGTTRLGIMEESWVTAKASSYIFFSGETCENELVELYIPFVKKGHHLCGLPYTHDMGWMLSEHSSTEAVHSPKCQHR